MCRLSAYCGAPIALEDIVITPPHSLLEQSQHATEAKMAVNGDGFGMAWYDASADIPGLYRDVAPAWSNSNLVDLCRLLRSGLFMAHVRASTYGETARANCHPFRYGRWSFAHNGQIGGFHTMRRALEALLPDALYEARQGSTDSELLFLLLLAFGAETDVKAAWSEVLARIASVRPVGAGPLRAAWVMSDGTRLMAGRFSSDGRAPTLYFTKNASGVTVSSEPLDNAEFGEWTLLDEGTWLSCTTPRDVRFQAAQHGLSQLSVA